MIARRLARPLLASIFIAGGADAVRNPVGKAPAARRLLGEWTPPGLDNTEGLVRVDGLVKVCAGIAFALGRAPRLSSLVLIASLVPTTLAGHRFWEESDADARAAQQLHLLKNAAIAGGLILAAVDTEGRPSLGWRAKHVLTEVDPAGWAADVTRKAQHVLPVG